MLDPITLHAFFGTEEHAFALTDPMLAELEHITGLGVGAIYYGLVNLGHHASTLTEIIRLGLIGGGTSPEIAKRLCATYAENRPLAEVFPLAFAIMEARWSGTGTDETTEEVALNATADFARFTEAAE